MIFTFIKVILKFINSKTLRLAHLLREKLSDSVTAKKGRIKQRKKPHANKISK